MLRRPKATSSRPLRGMNTSVYADGATANTAQLCARQRAQKLAALGCTSVLELCVGPSLQVLTREYDRVGLECWGNDIEARWKRYWPTGRWLIGDCTHVFQQHCQTFDAVVFAPPLSLGCSGSREDSLMIEQVCPSYQSFIAMARGLYHGHLVLTLPGRSQATREDRAQLHALLAPLWDLGPQLHPLRDGCTKYIDLHLSL